MAKIILKIRKWFFKHISLFSLFFYFSVLRFFYFFFVFHFLFFFVNFFFHFWFFSFFLILSFFNFFLFHCFCFSFLFGFFTSIWWNHIYIIYIFQRPLDKIKDETEISQLREHPQNLCEKCQSLGHYCRQLPEYTQ